MVRFATGEKSVGRSVERHARIDDTRAVKRAALVFLPLLALFFVLILTILLADPSVPVIVLCFVGAFASILGAIGWVAYVIGSEKRAATDPTRPAPTRTGPTD